LRANRVPRPKTAILQKGVSETINGSLGYPIVLKIPDGSFSRGVYKAADANEFKAITEKLFKESDLILAQEYVYTAFDWRIGILNRKPIYACQYFMSKNHWQIVNHKSGGRYDEGGFKTFAIEDAPADVVDAALKAANLIGDGLYGVDVKQNERGLYVIEVNDNPNVDSGIEDKLLDEELYRTILLEFAARLDRKRQA
jgi:glutathione synthase/RimK-type ligase-like ATP-grasp enzyme